MERGERVFSDGKHCFKHTGSHCGAFAPARADKGSGLTSVTVSEAAAGPLAPLAGPGMCFPTFIKLCWDVAGSRAV